MLLGAMPLDGSAHDVSVELGGNATAASANNPRVGSANAAVGASVEPNGSRWSLFGDVVYTRDLPTKTPTFRASGSDLFQIVAGATWVPTDALVTALELRASPPADQRNTTPIVVAGRSADADVDATSWSAGAQWSGAWLPLTESVVQPSVDVGLGATYFGVFQKMKLGSSPKAELVRTACATPALAAAPLCQLLGGASTPLLQGRLSAGVSARLFDATQVALAGAYYLYDRDPTRVAFFSLVSLGHADLGSGIPVLPLQFSLRPSVSHRLGPVTLRVAYQYAHYASDEGVNHALTMRVTWKASAAFSVLLGLTGQLDVAPAGSVLNLGFSASFGVRTAW